ncbi:zona pellucida sperm-binding protein 3-like protein [Pitangus sulphuratus]|nr:zona pellucida sperm-binding protein 3-like protein [Pitangus sulphuratus]
MELCWLVLVCRAVLGVAGTTVAPDASESPSHTVTAPVVSSDMGTGEVPAHPSSEEPIMNFTLRLLDGDPSTMGQPLVLSPSSAIHLEASVHFSPSFSMKIHVDQCYGTIVEQPGPSRRVFMVVNSQGCLHGEKVGSVSVQHWRGGSALQLSILAPTLDAFQGEGTLHWETAGPVLVQKEKVPWYEGPRHTTKRFLLAGLALVGSAVVVVAAVGGLLGLALTTWRPGTQRRGRRPPRHRSPFQAELQSVVGALVLRETGKRGEVGPDPLSLQ